MASYLALLLALTPIAAETPTSDLEVARTQPPAALGAGLRRVVGDEAYRMKLPNATVATFWLPKTCNSNRFRRGSGAVEKSEKRVNFGGLEPGLLLGIVRFDGSWIDYRGQPVEPGLYTLRYAIQPAFKDHVGVSPFRDFALLAPAHLDHDDPPASLEDAVARSRAVSGGGHPAVASIVPETLGTGRPTLLTDEIGEKILAANVCGTPLGLVVWGQSRRSDD